MDGHDPMVSFQLMDMVEVLIEAPREEIQSAFEAIEGVLANQDNILVKALNNITWAQGR